LEVNVSDRIAQALTKLFNRHRIIVWTFDKIILQRIYPSAKSRVVIDSQEIKTDRGQAALEAEIIYSFYLI
jgi:hypothetical protein